MSPKVISNSAVRVPISDFLLLLNALNQIVYEVQALNLSDHVLDRSRPLSVKSNGADGYPYHFLLRCNNVIWPKPDLILDTDLKSLGNLHFTFQCHPRPSLLLGWRVRGKRVSTYFFLFIYLFFFFFLGGGYYNHTSRVYQTLSHDHN